MTEPRWLLDTVVLALHSLLLDEHGGANGIRSQDMLASALNRPKNKFVYEPESTTFELAAAYSFAVVKNHPFTDGNKRTAFLCGTLFLEINGFTFSATETDAAITFENLAAGSVSEIQLASWFKLNSQQA